MRSIKYLGASALALLAVPAVHAADQDIVFVAGTGEGAAADAPLQFADEPADANDAQTDMLDMADQLGDPRTQEGVANMIGSMSEKMLDLPIGKFAVAMERAIPGGIRDDHGKRIRESDTLADLAGRDADRLPDQLAYGSRQMMGMMSGFAAAFASMIPEFEKLGREMEESFEEAKDTRRRRD